MIIFESSDKLRLYLRTFLPTYLDRPLSLQCSTSLSAASPHLSLSGTPKYFRFSSNQSLDLTLHRQFAYYLIFNIDLLLAQYNLLFFYTTLSTYSTLSSLLSYISGKKINFCSFVFRNIIFFCRCLSIASFFYIFLHTYLPCNIIVLGMYLLLRLMYFSNDTTFVVGRSHGRTLTIEGDRSGHNRRQVIALSYTFARRFSHPRTRSRDAGKSKDEQAPRAAISQMRCTRYSTQTKDHPSALGWQPKVGALVKGWVKWSVRDIRSDFLTMPSSLQHPFCHLIKPGTTTKNAVNSSIAD